MTTVDTVRVAGSRVRVEVTGHRGPPLLMIMGLGGRLDMWAPFARELGNRRLVTFDFPGTGASSLPLFPPAIPACAAFVRRLMHRLGINRADVLGYSWGGLVAQQLAVQHPRSVGRLVLACTSYTGAVVPRSLRGLLAVTTAAPSVGGPGTSALVGVAGQLFQLTAATTWSGLPVTPLIRSDTLVLAAADDNLVPSVYPRILARCIPGARATTVDDAGHLLFSDQPAAAASVITEFLQR